MRHFPAPRIRRNELFGNREQAKSPESLIDAFVEQDAHLGASEQQVFGLFERGEGRFTRNGRKTL